MRKERPILFSAPMIRALLANLKRQTRRLLKHQPTMQHYIPLEHADGTVGAIFSNKPQIEHGIQVEKIWCPYGKVGDRLWVRETWARNPFLADSECTGPKDCYYRATCSELRKSVTKWRPSIFMPRWASRITLEITEVRVDRLRSITEEDARAEGLPAIENPDFDPDGEEDEDIPEFSHVAAFAELWDKLNGAGSWDSDPWIWVISFKRVKGKTAKSSPSPRKAGPRRSRSREQSRRPAASGRVPARRGQRRHRGATA